MAAVSKEWWSMKWMPRYKKFEISIEYEGQMIVHETCLRGANLCKVNLKVVLPNRALQTMHHSCVNQIRSA